jgi:hypothetical protein
MTVEARILAMMIAPNGNPIFANMFNLRLKIVYYSKDLMIREQRKTL